MTLLIAMQCQRKATTIREDADGGLCPSTLVVTIGFAVDLGRLLERGGDSVRFPHDPAMHGLAVDEPACVPSFHYAVPPETIVNLLRLPEERCAPDSRFLIFTYFHYECRTVRVVLAAEPLPSGLTRTLGGTAVVGLTGTHLRILAAEEGELARVKVFLTERLAPFAYEPDGALP